MKYVFDIDDTISESAFRDYDNARPIESIASLIRNLKKMDGENVVCLYTSRGMVSCGGDLNTIEEKHRPRLERWLNENNVPYDELIFGKPHADVYVDDRAVRACDLSELGVEEYRGFSGARVVRIGNLIVKETDGFQSQKDWYSKALTFGFRKNIPRVFSAGLGKIYLEYIKGVPFSEALEKNAACSPQNDKSNLVYDIYNIIDAFSRSGENKPLNEPENYIEYVAERASAAKVEIPRDVRFEILNNPLLKIRTFCHGDLTPQNIILSTDGRVVMFDPAYKPFFSSYLLDASKFRVALRGLDNIISGADRRLNAAIPVYDSLFNDNEKGAIKALEKTHVIRVLYYALKLGKKTEEERLRALLASEG